MDSVNEPSVKKKNWFAKHKLLSVLLGLIVLSVIASSGGSDKKVTNAATTNTAAASQADKKTEARVPTEYKSALSQANSYANTQYMSKKGLYKQLTSVYGEKFSPEAAQYAVDNVKTDWNKNALYQAKSYQDEQHMSPAAIHDQLTSDYGEQFTSSEADYAILHLND